MKCSYCRWNPAQSRWERVGARRANKELYKLDNWEKGGVSTIQTKSGTAYIVSNCSSCNFTKRVLIEFEIFAA